MKKLTYFLAAILCLVIVAPLLAVNVSEDATYIIIETLGYKVHWNKPAQMGYMQAFVGGSPNSIIGEADRAFYHSSDYGGWSDWGELLNWEILEEDPAKVVIKYESRDARTKEYTCIATYYDTVPYIEHEVTITNTGDPTDAFASDHEPQFEVNVDTAGMEVFLEPYPYAIYWTADGYYGALYGPEAVSASVGEWDGRNPGRMQLGHNGIGGTIGNGESASITYYVAFGEGGRDAALALVDHVQEEPPTSAVSPAGNLTTKWGWIRAR